MTTPTHRRHGDPRLRPQRGRLRGAGRAARGWRLPPRRRPADAETVVVNTCGFVEAGQEGLASTPCSPPPTSRRRGRSEAPRPWSRSAASPSGTATSCRRRCPRPTRCSASTTTPTSPTGCAASWPARSTTPHTPRDRRTLLPISPVERATATDVVVPGPRPPTIGAGAPATGPRAVRRRLDGGPMAPLKLASGCDRRCSFCAIPSFRGSFVSRRPTDVLAEARWLGEQGVKELFLVSENSTSYGKDLGDLRLLETLLPELAAVDGVERVRVSYLQPAETRPGLVDRDREDPGGRGVLRPVLPARLGAGAPADAPLRGRRELPRPARPGPRPGTRGRGPVQLHRRLPGRDRGRLRDAVRLPRARPGSTRSASSATPTRTAPRPRRYDDKLDRGRRSASASSTSPGWSRS